MDLRDTHYTMIYDKFIVAFIKSNWATLGTHPLFSDILDDLSLIY